MREVGYKILKLNQVIMPGDLSKRLSTQNARDISESAFTGKVPIGLMSAPTVRQLTDAPGQVRFVLCAGGDRIAGCIKANVDRTYFRIVECDDREFEVMQIAENLWRRDDVDKRIERRERLEALIAGQVATEAQAGTLPNPKRLKGEIRDRIAKATGVKPETVRKQEQRAKARNEQAVVESQPVVQPEYMQATIQTFGYPLMREFVEPVEELKILMDRIVRSMTTVRGCLTQINTQKLPFPPGRLQAVRAAADELGVLLDGLQPTSLCAYCKGQDGLQEECGACAGLGFITKNQMNYPSELKSAGVVLKDGKFVRIESLDEPVLEDRGGVPASGPLISAKPIKKPMGIDPFAELED